MTTELVWGALQVFSKRGVQIRKEIERTHRRVCQPAYKRRWYTAGLLSQKPRELIAGYMFVETNAEEWDDLNTIEGVIGVLANDGKISRVPYAEIRQMELDELMGTHDAVEAPPEPPEAKKKYTFRRRRPGNRLRLARALGAAA